MTVLHRTTPRGLLGTLVALIGIGLGGCAATNVGNSWQCPLVQGSACARVAEADPAAPQRVSMGTPADVGTATESSAVRARRYRNGTGARVPATGSASRPRASEPTCRGSCRPQDRPARNAGSTDDEPVGRSDTQAETASQDDDLKPEGSWRESARTPEVLGRIWIAPYVDAAGVYHEASWVRVVIEASGWRKTP